MKPKIGTRVRYTHILPCMACRSCDGDAEEGIIGLHADASSEGRISFSFEVRVDFPDGNYVWTDARKLEVVLQTGQSRREPG